MISGKPDWSDAEENLEKDVEEGIEEGIEETVFVFPASFAQQRLWFVEQLLPGSSPYTIPLVFRLTGSLHRSALAQSIQAIVCRHEILRTTFDWVDGQLIQVIASELPVPLQAIDLRTLPDHSSNDSLNNSPDNSPNSDRENIALEQIRQEIQQPFDLNKGPLFRVRLWQLQDAEHLLLMSLHHIVFDEWSSGVLIRELGELYTASVNQQSAELTELPIQYADFAHWQRQWLQGEVLNAQLRYWKQQLKDVPTLHLPGTGSRPVGQRYRGNSQLLELPQRLLDALESLSQQSGVTLFMTLLAAFQTLLHRYTGQTDLAIGSPIANRQRSELEGLIGFLVNSLVLRTDLAGDPTFRALLDRVRDVTLAAYDHQDLPFEKLVEELQPVRNLGQNPLFQVVFALQNTPMEQLELPGLILSPVEFETKTTRFDLELYVWKCAGNFRSLWGKGWQQSDGLRGVVVYNADLFDQDTIASLRQHFQTLLEGIVANPNTPLSTLPLLTFAEQQALFSQWNRTQTLYPANVCIHQLFEAQVRQRPTAIAVQFAQQQFTYQELNQGCNQLARYLQKSGVTAAMPVGICLERSAEAIAAMLAVLKAGGAYVPLDPSYPPERLHFLLEDAGIQVVLTQEDWTDLFQTSKTRVICLQQAWESIAQESDENLSTSGTADQLAYVIYTSGSTGTPKGVMVPHRAVNRLVRGTNYVQIEPGDKIAQIASLSFDAATFEIWGALLNGAQIVGIDRETTLSPIEFVAALQQIDILFLTTALFNQTVSQIPDAFRSLKYLLFGGEMVCVDQVRLVLQQGKPQHLIHVYGPTENTTFSTWYEVQAVPENASTIPIGQAIANTQVYVLDADLRPVPSGVTGEIYLAGDGLAQGYLNRSELTTEKFVHTENSILYKTGDRARYSTDGNLEFLGRTDHQIKIRGFRVELGEIESVLTQHPLVQAAVVVVREVNPEVGHDRLDSDSPDLDRQLIAYVVPKAAAPTERDLRSFLKQRLPAYMLPAGFVVLAALPLTPNGKVDHKALPAPNLFAARETLPPVLPTTSLEKFLVDLWMQLLGRKQIGIHDNFFELGGHSLLATQLVSRIRDRFQVEMPLRSVFETPTIAELAEKIATLTGSEETLRTELPQELVDRLVEPVSSSHHPHFSEADRSRKSQSDQQIPTIQPAEGTVFPLSFAQQRLWFLYQLAPDNPFYNVPAAIRLTGLLDQAALERSFNQIVRRHSALRTTFTTINGQPVQVILPEVKIELAVVNLQSAIVHDSSTDTLSERERISQQLVTTEAQRPFNLTTDPLLRVTLLQFNETDLILLLTLHHIVADGWSLGVLIRELACLYTAQIEKQTPVLPALPIQYTDFACWQRNWLQGGVLEKQLAYWRSQLQDLPLLHLPSDRPRLAVQSYQGATYPLQISPALTQALATLSQQSGVSLFMILLAAFQTLLYRYTGQEDIAIGSPIANRHHTELEGLIGFFVNSLVIRSDLSGNPTFCELLERVRDVTLEAYAHQDLPFEKLVEELDPERDLSRNPLFQVAFALQNAPMQALELPGLKLEPAPLASGSTRFDLEVHLWEPAHGLRSLWQSQEGLSGFIAYSTDLFDRDRISRLVGHFQTLLAGIVANPDDRLSELPLLTTAEHQRILREWSRSPLAPLEKRGNQTIMSEAPLKENLRGMSEVPLKNGDLGGSQELCFHQIFEAQVAYAPEAIAIVSEQGSLTYAELNQQADRLAQILQQMGVRPDDLVGLCVDRSPDMIIGILGILKAGAAYVPLDPQYPRDRLHFMLTDTQVAILLTQSWLVESLPSPQAKILCLDQPLPPIAPPASQKRKGLEGSQSPPELGDLGGTLTPDHLAYVIYTSGSTGTPKGVLLTHRGLCNVVEAQQQVFPSSRESRILQFSSLSFDASIFEIALAFGCGGTLYIPPPSAQLPGISLIKFLQDNAITHALLTPAVLAALPATNLPTLQVLITGGEACSRRVVDRWAVNRRFFNAYGPTEVTIWATVAELHPDNQSVTIGKPIANTQVYILDTALNPVPAGIPGELYIGGAGLARGYLNRPELTKERFTDNPFAKSGRVRTWESKEIHPFTHPPIHPSTHSLSFPSRLYKTGDRACYRTDGTIEFLGRIDTQIKIRGFRVELGEIEATLQRHSAIQDAVVITQDAVVITSEDSSNDSRLVAYFSLNASAKTLHQHLKQAILQCQTQQIQHWQTLYNQTYQPDRPLLTHPPIYSSTHPPFNITGWNSSYTGAPIPMEQMQEWVSDRVRQILAFKPRRVLEIGCGTGLLLFQIAPHCQEYVGTDFSTVSLESLQLQLQHLDLPQVKLLHRVATDFEGINDAFDLVILNSIVQYFPSQDYLVQVLEGAIQAVAPGGILFLGDVRSLPLLTAFHTWMKFSQADAATERTQLRQQVERSRFEEPELAIDPAFFQALCNRFPQIQQVQVRLSRGRSQNEMTQFRYNVLLYVGNESITANTQLPHLLNPIQNINWKDSQVTATDIQKHLSTTEPGILKVTNISNRRVNAATKTVDWLFGEALPKTVRRMREVLQNSIETAIDPQDWWDLETVLPYKAEITWSTETRTGDYDVILIRHGVDEKAAMSIVEPQRQFSHCYTNDPLQSVFARQLIPELRQHLRQTLPDYMIPSTFIPLETLPLTANGKVDRASIAQQYRHVPALDATLHSPNQTIASHTPTELTLIDIWKELLHFKQVNIHDNFFESGGHSLLATQMTSRVRDAFGLELPLTSVFAAPTIAQLAPVIERLRDATPAMQIPSLVQLDRASHLRLRSSNGISYSSQENSQNHSRYSSPDQSHKSPSHSHSITSSDESAKISWSPLVPLTLVGQKQPFFCIHPMFGVVFPYLELAHQLGDRSFYGLQPLGLNGKHPPLNRIEAIAAYYVQAIQTVQPCGPYLLGGWSFGGLVAFEMAQQLTQAGQQIALLAILDTPAPVSRHQPSLSQSLKFLLGTALWSTLPFLLDYGTIATNRFRTPWKTWFSRWQWSAIARLIPEESRLRLLDESAIVPMLQIVYANSQAAYQYVPHPYFDRVTLFKAAEQPGSIEQNLTLGWDTLAKDIQLHQVPGNHLSLLKQPHVQTLADQLRQYLS